MRRDLKPENFLLFHKGDDAPLKATDFGLSVFYRPGQVLTDVVGSAYYVAPEVGCFPIYLPYPAEHPGMTAYIYQHSMAYAVRSAACLAEVPCSLRVQVSKRLELRSGSLMSCMPVCG